MYNTNKLEYKILFLSKKNLPIYLFIISILLPLRQFDTKGQIKLGKWTVNED